MLDSTIWHEAAAARARDFRLRTAFAVVITLAGAVLVRNPWPLVWFQASLLAQAVSLWIGRPMCADPAYAPSFRRQIAFLASIALSTGVYAGSAPLFWFSGGWEGRVFAFTVLTACVLHVGLLTRSSSLIMWFSAAPFILLLPALPLVSFIIEPEAEQFPAAFIGVAALLYVGHLFSALRASAADYSAVRAALKEAESERTRAEGASAAKTEFLTNISHEIRTPLNGVLGMAQALAADELKPVQRERVEVLRQSGEILLLLLNDLLDISRIEAAKLELEEGVIDLPALVAHAEAVFGALASAKGVGLQVQLRDTARGARAGDPKRVRQVLFNLLGNAVKFTERGGVTATLAAVDDEIVIEVADTGPGIPAERLGGLFQRFAQADASTTRRYGGSGLGLAIARELARLMGGDIAARSTLGEGSVFTARLRLPPVEAAAPTPVEPPAPSAGAIAALSPRLRVLAAEDNPVNQLVLRTLLERVGIEPHVVENGREALAAWRAARWDLVLMDIHMPLMDGIAAVRAIRAAEAREGRRRTPILALSANAMAHQAAEYAAAGLDGLVPKPIQVGQLLAAVAAAAQPDPEPEMQRAG